MTLGLMTLGLMTLGLMTLGLMISDAKKPPLSPLSGGGCAFSESLSGPNDPYLAPRLGII